MKIFLFQVFKDGVWLIAGSAPFAHIQDAIDEAMQHPGWAMDRMRVRAAPDGYRAPPEHCCPECGESTSRFHGRRYICRGCGIVLKDIST